tara:strand:+ start:396 stop:851 length:456 start_codon:yes stop_codon:yes gene_type:complete
MAYGVKFYDSDGEAQQSNDSKNSRILFAGTGSPPNPTDGAQLLYLDGYGFNFSLNTGLVLCRCAPVKYEFDNYTSTADLGNTLDINGPIGTASNPSDNTFDLAHILSQATDYDSTYLWVDHGDSLPTGANVSNISWSEARADFAPIVVYYG